MAPQEEGRFGWPMARPTCPPSEAESRGGRDSATGASAGRSLQEVMFCKGQSRGRGQMHACQMPAFGGIPVARVCACVDMCVYT